MIFDLKLVGTWSKGARGTDTATCFQPAPVEGRNFLSGKAVIFATQVYCGKLFFLQALVAALTEVTK